MRYTLAAMAGLCVLASAGTVSTTAIAETIIAEANVAHSEGDWGGEVAVGVPVISDGGFSITPGVGAFFHHNDHDGYSKDDDDCFRDADGAQVKDSRCDSSGTKIFAKAEAVYRLPTGLGFGIGGRFISGDFRAYGTLMAPILPRLDVKANLGDHYLAAGVQARF